MCDVEGTLRALQHPRRRHALDCIRTHQSVALADLAELVLERETGTDASDHDAERVSRVYFSLYHTHLPVLQDAALVRELHVYGSEAGIGADGDWQHKGYGKKLLAHAEELSRDAGYDKISVISGIGVRQYYKEKLGYHQDGPYVSKRL